MESMDQFDKELTREDLERFVSERVQLLWSHFGWQCQHEIVFTEQPVKAGVYATVKKRPKDMNNPNEKFQVVFWVGRDNAERAEILKMSDFIIMHEVAHSIVEAHRAAYAITLTQEQKTDLNLSAHIKPELFYSGAHEIASDMIALRIAEETGKQRQVISSFVSLVAHDVSREQAGKLDPSLTDQARFMVFIDQVKPLNTLSDQESASLREALEFWQSSRDSMLLDEVDKERFAKMAEYFRETADRTKGI